MSGGGHTGAPGLPLSSKEQQARDMAETRERLRVTAHSMKRAMDSNDLKLVLRHANTIVMELRTNDFTPKVYYELYMEAFDQLDALERYFARLARTGTPMSTIYDMVQQTANVLARLYLMITAGSVYIKSGQIAAKDVLMDLLDLVKGVQHPQRGLFLRYYLIQMCKDKLPDIGTAYEGVGGSLDDALNFIIANFGEMNRLWVRMQHSGHLKNKRRRERERQELRILVGTSLNVLSSLSGLDAKLYTNTILPRLLSEVEGCKDKIAQPYLIECIVQAFPIEYLYENLNKLLEVLPSLVQDFNVLKPILVTIINRIKEDGLSISSGVTDGEVPRVPPSPDVFYRILDTVQRLASEPTGAFRVTSLPGTKIEVETPKGTSPSPVTPYLGPAPEAVAALLEVYTAAISFAITCFPTDFALFDRTLASCTSNLDQMLGAITTEVAVQSTGKPVKATATLKRLTSSNTAEAAAAEEVSPEPAAPVATTTVKKLSTNLTDQCSELVVGILSLLQSTLGLQVLSLENYAALMSPLTFTYRRTVAVKLLDAVLLAGVRVQSVEIARRLLSTLSPLLRDEEGSSEHADAQRFLTEQHSVAKLIHLLGGTTDAAVLANPKATDSTVDTDAHFQVYALAGEQLSHGGSKRVGITLPPLVFDCLQLAKRIRTRETAGVKVGITSKKVYHFLHEYCTALGATATELALTLFLQCALNADIPGVAAEFFSQAFILYEEITESKKQARYLEAIACALHSARAVDGEYYESLCTRCTQLSIKLLRTADQVKLVLLCARLFWRSGPSDYHKPKELLHCLQKALALVDACLPPQPALFVEIFNAYVYFFEKRVPTVQSVNISDLISLCREQTAAMKGAEKEAAVKHLQNILSKIDYMKTTKEGAVLYADVSTSE